MAVPPRLETLGEILSHQCSQRPDATAIIYQDNVVSYAQLEARANQVTAALLAGGLRKGDRVAHLGKNSDSYFEIFFGTARAGGVLTGVNWRLAPREVAFVIADCGARVVFVDEEFFDVLADALDTMDSVETVICLSGSHPTWLDYIQWRDAHATAPSGPSIGRDDVVLQLYTSGTTGNPKGAQLTHDGFLAPRERADEMGDWSVWDETAVQLVCTPMFHVSGCAWSLFAFWCGGTLLIHRDFDTDLILDDLVRHRFNYGFFVPAMLLMILQNPRAASADYSSLKIAYYGASPIPLNLLKKAQDTFGCGFVQFYGMTETTGVCTYLPPDDHSGKHPERLRSAGIPFPGVCVRIIDEDGKDVPSGEVGQIAIGGRCLMAGYWQRDEANQEIFQEGWLLTGDAGYQDRDGYVYVHDRVKDMIISGGENIYPAEIESILFSHPKVADVAVIGVPCDEWGEAVKAVVVKAKGQEPTADELIGYARDTIAHYKCPKSVDFVDQIPRNPTGKILKRELRKLYWTGREREIN